MNLRNLLIFVLIIILLGVLSYFSAKFSGNIINSADSEEYKTEKVYVTKVIDGDTIELEGKIKVRLLGINTPEKKNPYYNEAKNYLKRIENKTVFIMRDDVDKDRYNRLLRYVYYNDELLNSLILQKGLATSFLIEGLRYQEKLKSAEEYAINNNLGLWKKSKNLCSDCIKLINLDAKQEFFTIKNNCNFDCNLTSWYVKDDANHFFYLKDLNSNESKTYYSKTEIWNNDKDRFFLRDSYGDLVIFSETS
jgi:micrococcal nuclease